MESTISSHIAERLTNLGVGKVFCVPGDFNLHLLDGLQKDTRLQLINTCSELNAGYAAEGYSRARGGVSCCVVTFTVGGLSVLNAIAGAYSEDLPVICISGAPNVNDLISNRILHHTTGLPYKRQEQLAFREVTCHQADVLHVEDAFEQIDHAFSKALEHRKQVYISIAANVRAQKYSSFESTPLPLTPYFQYTSKAVLERAVDDAATLLNSKSSPVLLFGSKIRHPNLLPACMHLIDATGYAFAASPDAKGILPENHEQYMGIHWGQVGAPGVTKVVEEADGLLCVGVYFNDYNTAAFSAPIYRSKLVQADPDMVRISSVASYTNIDLREFLEELANTLERNSGSLEQFRVITEPSNPPAYNPEIGPLTCDAIATHLQEVLTSDYAIVADVGEAWFLAQKLQLPEGCRLEMQMQYASIGWGVGATLGYQAALEGQKRVILIVGDGAFQVTAPDISTMIRFALNPIIIVLNNGAYAIEDEIHGEQPYNTIARWDYKELVRAMGHVPDDSWAANVHTEEGFIAALRGCMRQQAKLCLLDCHVDRHDVSKQMSEWGKLVALETNRAPLESSVITSLSSVAI